MDKGSVARHPRDAWFGRQPARFDAVLGPTPRMFEDTGLSNSRACQSAEMSVYTDACDTVDRYQTGYTLLGFVAFRFHQRVSWCYTGSGYTITSIDTYASDVDAFEYDRGVVGSWNDPHETYHVSFRRGMFENCIPVYGCLSASYPSVTITVDQWGGSSYTTGW